MQIPTVDAVRAAAEAQRERIIEDTVALVRLPSVNPYSGDATAGNERAAQEHMAHLLAEAGGRVEQFEPPADCYEQAGIVRQAPPRSWADRPNVLAEFVLGAGGRSLVLNCHMDTVGAEGMTIDPFSGEVKDGCIYGRGSTDSKGNLVMGLAAVRILQQLGGVDGRICFQSVIDEECSGGGAGTLACCLRGIDADAALCMDGSGLSGHNGCSGVLTPLIRVPGESGHAAYNAGVNALEKAVGLYPAYRKLKADREAEDPINTVNWTVCHAGSTSSAVPAEAEMRLHMQYNVAEARKAEAAGRGYGGWLVRDRVEAVFHEAAAADEFLAAHPLKFEWIKDLYPFRTDAAAPIAGALTGAMQQVLGRPATLEPIPAWLDAAHLTVQAKLPAVSFGCGAGGVAHGPAEHVRIDDQVTGAAVLALTVARFFGGA
jgi:acetylornithine deacetylase/succinyl-diaminopimelate desuccinylase-like protein